MKLQIRTKGFSLTDGIRAHTERRLAFAMDRFAGHVRSVLVWLGDVNGPRGGADKCCRIAVEVVRGWVVLEERAPDLYDAINRATKRAAEKVSREVSRLQQHPRWAARAGGAA